jgi:hypothetical protein
MGPVLPIPEIGYAVSTWEKPDRSTGLPFPHTAHLFSGWTSFLEHLREAHGVDPPADDLEAWSLHAELHASD